MFEALGCKLRVLSHDIPGPDGPYRIRYLFNPKTKSFVSVSDLADDEFVSLSTVENWERRLGITLPRNLDS